MWPFLLCGPIGLLTSRPIWWPALLDLRSVSSHHTNGTFTCAHHRLRPVVRGGGQRPPRCRLSADRRTHESDSRINRSSGLRRGAGTVALIAAIGASSPATNLREIKSSKQLFTAAAFMGIICIIPPQEAAFFGTADLKKITIGDHVLGQHLGLLGWLESAIWSAPAILGIDMPGQLPVETSGLVLTPNTNPIAIT